MSAVLSRPFPASPWRSALPALLLALAATLVLFQQTAASMVAVWANSATFTHAFLVPPIVLWLVWRDRRRIAAQVPSPEPWVLAPMLLVGLLWLAGELLYANALSHLAFTTLLVLCVPLVAGWPVARAMLFPLLFAFLAVPIGDFLLPVLMSMTADFTVLALRLSGIPVYREGQQFMIPSGNWSVVEACSGVRYLMASLMVGALFAYLNFTTLRKRLVFLAFALLVPIVANWVRAYLIVLIGHLSNNKLAVGVDHLVYGWVFFGVVVITLYVVAGRWADAPRPHELQPGANPTAAPARTVWAVTAAAALMLSLPHLAMGHTERRVLARGPLHLSAPDVPGWTRGDPDSAYKPVYREPDAQWLAGFTAEGEGVTVFLAYYRAQARERKLLSSENVVATSHDGTWAVLGSRRQTVDLARGAVDVEATQLVTQPSAPHRLVRQAWRLYWVDGRWTGDALAARAWIARERLLGRGDAAAALVVYGDSPGRLHAFLNAALPAIGQRLAQADEAHPLREE